MKVRLGSPRIWLFGLLAAALAQASLVRIEVQDQSEAGPYTRIVGRAYFAVDPRLPANRIISDIELAPRNEKGLVEFSADLYILRPRDPARANGAALFEVSNRGNKGLLSMFNRAQSSRDPRSPADFGDQFLAELGFTLVWLGWQYDVPPGPGLLRFQAPAARGVRGLVRSDYVPDQKITSLYLADRDHIAYPVAEPDDPGLQLTVRERSDGPRRTVPRGLWKLDASRTRLLMESGFEPGKIYEIVYQAQDPAVAGLGPAAVRDFISHLKHGDPASGIRRAIGFGTSQSGRFLRTFLYYGFNQDEQGRRVFDGVWAHVAGGGRGSFNHRFAQPSRSGRPFFSFFYPTDIFPFTDQEQTDPETGLTDGLLARAEKAGVAPKIFYTNSSYEYYGRAGSLIHTTIDGKRDLPPPGNTRAYLLAGAQHGPGQIPPPRQGTQNLTNANDYRWAMRALLAAFDGWIAQDKQPPASQHPRISADNLVALGAVSFPKIPGVAFPTRIHRAYRVDYGPDFRSKGIVSVEPPRVGKAFPTLVPQVDAEGNETSGIRLPVVQVPLATYTGWNLRDPALGAPGELVGMAGSYIPFPRTRAEREKLGDPRRSIEERYPSRERYLSQIETAARALTAQSYVLERDIAKIVEQAGQQWDWVIQTGPRF